MSASDPRPARPSRLRRRRTGEDDADPLDGMANLFDIAMVFAVALMVAVVTRMHVTELFTDKNFTMVKNPGTPAMEIIVKDGQKIDRYQASGEAGTGKGKRVGAAYQLESGEIIYVPEK